MATEGIVATAVVSATIVRTTDFDPVISVPVTAFATSPVSVIPPTIISIVPAMIVPIVPMVARPIPTFVVRGPVDHDYSALIASPIMRAMAIRARAAGGIEGSGGTENGQPRIVLGDSEDRDRGRRYARSLPCIPALSHRGSWDHRKGARCA